MKSAVINFKVDPKLKAAAQVRAKKLGVSLSTVLYGHLTAFARGDGINIEFPEEQMTPHLEKQLKEADNEVKKGEISPEFDSADMVGMRQWLESHDED